jgi:hypothetical protein
MSEHAVSASDIVWGERPDPHTFTCISEGLIVPAAVGLCPPKLN